MQRADARHARHEDHEYKNRGCEWQYAFIRGGAFRYLISYVSFLLLLVGYLMAFASRNKQTLHDKVAGTFVVRR
ncbi:MAG: RDD family protein [Proteobacteria bacterium]|nr:RDD family protein [Pseudomonadota bacterium]